MSVTAANPYADLGITRTAATGPARSTELGQNEFLRLMTEQLKNQDPLKPMDSAEFLGQLAQFSTVKGIQQLDSSMQSIAAGLDANQMLQGAALVGKYALVPSETAMLGEGGAIDGSFDAPNAGPINIQISDASGNLVRQLTVTATGPGAADFHWDGRDASGAALPAGEYKIAATIGSGSATQALPALISMRVESVSLSSYGLVVNLAGIGAVPLSSVYRIGAAPAEDG